MLRALRAACRHLAALCVCLSPLFFMYLICPGLCKHDYGVLAFYLVPGRLRQALIFSHAHFCTQLEQVCYTSQAPMTPAAPLR